MINTVFSAFNFKPASLGNWTSLSNNVIISEENIANINCALHGLPAGIQVSLHFTSLHFTSLHLQMLNPKVVASHHQDQIQTNMFPPMFAILRLPNEVLQKTFLG